MAVTLSERASGAVTIVDIVGAFGDGADQHLHDKIRSLLQQGRKNIVVNLASVPYLDSVGLGALVHSYATVAGQGGALKLLHATKRLRDLLVITKLATVFEMFDDEAAAVASFSA